MKKLLFLLSIIFSISVTANAAPIKSYTETIPVSDSISLTKVEEFYSNRNISYSYIKADLSDPNTSLTLLKSDKGTDVTDTVANLAATKNDTVVALNADFFSNFSAGKSFSLGIEIKDGELIQSPINPGTMATVSYSGESVLMSYLDFHIMTVAPNGSYNEIRHLNKHTSYFGDILMYTHDFNGGYSPAPGGEVLEVVVSGGKITEFRRNLPPVQIPEDGCVLVVSEGINMFFANNFNVGDEIRFDYYITPDIKNAETAFGGGAMLVQDGNLITDNYSHVVSGYQPRSAIGVDKNGTTLIMVAVNGRQEKSRGMSMYELSHLMYALGCHNAVNLDGGGSTNMYASTVWYEKMHKVNSPTENRKVINAVGLNYNAPKGEIYGIMLEPDKNAVFIGQPLKITSAVHDQNMRPLDEKISWSSDSGSVSDGVFTGNSEGMATINAQVGNAQASTGVYVVDTVSGIEVDSHVAMKMSESKELNISVFDSQGHFVEVTNTAPFEITSSHPEIVSVSGKTLTALQNGTAIISVKKDGCISYTSVAVGTDEFKAATPNLYTENRPLQKKADFVIGALSHETNTLLSRLVNARTEDYLSGFAENAVIGKIKGFSSHENEHALFVNLDTSKGGIRSTSSTQWDSMVSAINATAKENVFILSDNSIFGNSEFENKVIKDYLASLDKNVFVITGSNRNTLKIIDGVHYFTLGNEADEILSVTHLNNYEVLEFSFDGGVSFNRKNFYN